jgi:CheY-like chemotaxis protein
MSGGDEPSSESGSSPTGEPLLGRVRSVAQSIADRVHTVLNTHAPEPPPVTPIDPAQPLRVLVVDDNPDAADALAAVAELLGCEARSCYGGPEALDALQAELPDVLLLDLSMPVVDGLTVAARARARAGGRPLLLVATTALGSLEDRIATALAGFHYHLIKPIDLPALRAALEHFRALYHGFTPEPNDDADVPGAPD